MSESTEHGTSSTEDSTTSLDPTSEEEDTGSDEDNDDNSDDDNETKFDLSVSDLPPEPKDCKENEEENAQLGIFCLGTRPSQLALVDSDGDGRIEVVVTHNNDDSSGRQFYIFEQTGSGLEATDYSPVPYPSVDEWPDISVDAYIVALPQAQGTKQDWLGAWGTELVSAGTFFSGQSFNPIDPQARFLFSEMRVSGDLIPQVIHLDEDLAAAYVDLNGQLTVRVRDQQNQWQDPQYYPEHKGWPVNLETDDINRDGKQDLVIFGTKLAMEPSTGIDQTITVRFGDGQGDFSTFVHHDKLGLETIAEAKLGDITGDGIPDAILLDQKKLHVAAGLENSEFDVTQPQTIDFPEGDFSAPGTIHVADFNDDQRSDVAVVDCKNLSLHILLSNPEGKLDLSHSIPTIDCARYQPAGTLHSLDVNGDGALDLLAIGQHSETLRVYFGDGQGTFVVQ